MPAQHLGAASLDGAHDLFLVGGQHVTLTIHLRVRTEDVRDLDSRSPRRTRRPFAEHRLLRGPDLSESVKRAPRPPHVTLAHQGVPDRGPNRPVPEESLDRTADH
jgi:hypothetical protein